MSMPQSLYNVFGNYTERFGSQGILVAYLRGLTNLRTITFNVICSSYLFLTTFAVNFGFGDRERYLLRNEIFKKRDEEQRLNNKQISFSEKISQKKKSRKYVTLDYPSKHLQST